MVSRKVLYTLFGFLFLLLLLPLLQQQLKVVDSGVLNGVVVTDTARPALSLKTWLDGSFQEGYNNAVQNNAGFRPDFIRLNNQLNYSLFRKTNAHVTIGKNGNLFEQPYIDAYLGRDFAGEDKIRERVRKMKYIQDTLDKLGKHFVFIYAPSKVRYMPEDIPDKDKSAPGRPTNYETYLRLGTAAGLRQIDFNGWFVTQRHKRKHLLFARSSIHWTFYGALVAADSFQRFMKVKCRQDIPDITWNEDQQDVTGTARYSENDLEKLLNLVSPVAKEQFFHPDISIKQDSTRTKPSAIYIADSYMWMWMDEFIPHNLNSGVQSWSYYYEIYSPQRAEKGFVSEIDPMKEMLKADWIVILYTECNFSLPGSLFPEEAYDYFTGKGKAGQ